MVHQREERGSKFATLLAEVDIGGNTCLGLGNTGAGNKTVEVIGVACWAPENAVARNDSLVEIGGNKPGKLEHTGIGGEAAAETRDVFKVRLGARKEGAEIGGHYLGKIWRRRGGLHYGRNSGKGLGSAKTCRGARWGASRNWSRMGGMRIGWYCFGREWHWETGTHSLGQFSLEGIRVGRWARLKGSFLPSFFLWDHFVSFFC